MVDAFSSPVRPVRVLSPAMQPRIVCGAQFIALAICVIMVPSGRLRHKGTFVLRWCISTIVAKAARGGNLHPTNVGWIRRSTQRWR